MHSKAVESHRWNIRHRHGYALIEMIAVMSISAMILAVLFTALTGIVRRVSDSDRAVSRLHATVTASEVLRKELGSTAGFEIVDDGATLITHPLADRTRSIAWRLAQRPLRLEQSDKADASPRILGLPGFEKGRFERFEIEGGRSPLVALELIPDDHADRRVNRAGPVRPLRLEFAVGGERPIEPASKSADKGESP